MGREEETKLRRWLRSAELTYLYLRRYAGSTIMQIAFDKRAPTPNDHAITEVRVLLLARHPLCFELTTFFSLLPFCTLDAQRQRANDQDCRRRSLHRFVCSPSFLSATALIPLLRTVDSLPFLNHLPKALAPWKREADDLFLQTLKLFKGHVDDVSFPSSIGALFRYSRWSRQRERERQAECCRKRLKAHRHPCSIVAGPRARLQWPRFALLRSRDSSTAEAV